MPAAFLAREVIIGKMFEQQVKDRQAQPWWSLRLSGDLGHV
jgi:hypothetical protein